MYSVNHVELKNNTKPHFDYLQKLLQDTIKKTFEDVGVKFTSLEVTPYVELSSKIDIYSGNVVTEMLDIFWDIHLVGTYNSGNDIKMDGLHIHERSSVYSVFLDDFLSGQSMHDVLMTELQDVCTATLYLVWKAIIHKLDEQTSIFLRSVHYFHNQEQFTHIFVDHFKVVFGVADTIKELCGKVVKFRSGSMSGMSQDMIAKLNWGMTAQHTPMELKPIATCISFILSKNHKPYLREYDNIFDSAHQGFLEQLCKIQIGEQLPYFDLIMELYSSLPEKISLYVYQDINGYAFVSNMIGHHKKPFGRKHGNGNPWIYILRGKDGICRRTNSNTQISKRAQMVNDMMASFV